MPNCDKHQNCDLVCIECGDYYCRGEHDRYKPSAITLWQHVPRPQRRAVRDDMPDDVDEYYNNQAEQRWGP